MGRGISIVLILAVLVGAVLVLDGIGRLVQADSLGGRLGRALGTDSSTINIIVAIIELAVGAIVLLLQVTSLGNIDGLLKLLCFFAYIAVIVLVLFIGNLAADTLSWWISLVQSGIVLAVIWLLRSDL